MGLIKALAGAIGGSLADQWLEVVQPADLGPGVIFTKGSLMRRDSSRNSNYKGTEDIISNGTRIHVPENTSMLLVDGGKIVGMTAESGYYTVDNSTAPSIFNGQLKDSVIETFNRFKFGGISPNKQEVFYVNLQEIRDIKFGTPNPLMYHDSNYDLDLEVKTHGSYSVKVTDPILFYKEVVAKSQHRFTVEDFNEQFRNEFIEALQVSIASLSIEGLRITELPVKGTELSNHMSNVLDASWEEKRGLEIVSVGIASIVYTEDSKEILKIRNQGSVLRDASIRQGYVQGSMARGFEAAGSNQAGAGTAFMGMGIGMNATGNMFGEMSKANQEQMEMERKLKEEAQNKVNPSGASWKCSQCQTENTGNFCSNCGSKKPESNGGFCSNCGMKFEGQKPKFCPNCGTKTE